MKYNMQYVDMHSNLLIIGEGATNYGYKEINLEKNPEEVEELYGVSPLSSAFKTAYEIGVPNIFLLNIKEKSDYFDILSIIKQNDFAYIVCVNLNLSDDFRDVYEIDKMHSFYSYILGTIGNSNQSTFVVTDKHASAYEDIDAFLEGMDEAVATFKRRCSSRAELENIIVVANNLKDTYFADVVLASYLCVTGIGDYPKIDKGQAIFHIDPFDNPNDFAYFKTHVDGTTTIENLINCKEHGAEKIVPVSVVTKFLYRAIDFSDFQGKLDSEYIRLRIRDRLDHYLSSIMGSIIVDYEIIGIIPYYKRQEGYVDIICKYKVQPRFSLESILIEKRVEVGE